MIEKPDFASLEQVLNELAAGITPATPAGPRPARPPAATGFPTQGRMSASSLEDPNGTTPCWRLEPGDAVLVVHVAGLQYSAGWYERVAATDQVLAVARLLRAVLRMQDRLTMLDPGPDDKPSELLALILGGGRAGVESVWTACRRPTTSRPPRHPQRRVRHVQRGVPGPMMVARAGDGQAEQRSSAGRTALGRVSDQGVGPAAQPRGAGCRRHRSVPVAARAISHRALPRAAHRRGARLARPVVVGPSDRGSRRAPYSPGSTSCGRSRRDHHARHPLRHEVVGVRHTWTGVASPTCSTGPAQAGAGYVLQWGDGGYTANVPLADLVEDGIVAYELDGAPLPPEHGYPARVVLPALYFWKSAKWLRALEVLVDDRPGYWERNGYHMRGDPFGEQRFGRGVSSTLPGAFARGRSASRSVTCRPRVAATADRRRCGSPCPCRCCRPTTTCRWPGRPRPAGFDTIAVPDSVFFPETVTGDYPFTGDGERWWAPDTPFLDPFVAIPAMAASPSGSPSSPTS